MDPRDEMQQPLIEYLRKSELAQPWEAVEKAETLEAMMEAGWELALLRSMRAALAEQGLGAQAVDRGGSGQ